MKTKKWNRIKMKIKKWNKLLNKNKLKLGMRISKNNGQTVKITINHKLKNQIQKLNKPLKKPNILIRLLLVISKSNNKLGHQKKKKKKLQKKVILQHQKSSSPQKKGVRMEMVDNGQWTCLKRSKKVVQVKAIGQKDKLELNLVMKKVLKEKISN